MYVRTISDRLRMRTIDCAINVTNSFIYICIYRLKRIEQKFDSCSNASKQLHAFVQLIKSEYRLKNSNQCRYCQLLYEQYDV